MDLLDRFVTRPISYSILQVDFKIIALDVLDRQSLGDRFSVTNLFFFKYSNRQSWYLIAFWTIPTTFLNEQSEFSITAIGIFELRNISFIEFVKFERKQWFSAYQEQFCAWFGLARLPTKTARDFFLDHFLKETALSFFFLLLEPVQCLGNTFLCLIFSPVT